MRDTDQDKNRKKEAMKALRESRKAFVKTASAKMKIQKKAIEVIQDHLQEGARTVPEISTATGISTAETLWYVATLKKYGVIKEAEKDGCYFKYELAEGVSTAASD